MTKQTRQYGTWPSPISPTALAGDLRLIDVQWDTQGTEETLVWLEGRGKRGVLLAQTGDDAPRELTDEQLSVSARVGYGGGEFTVGAGHVYFAANGRLYRQALASGTAKSLTPSFGAAASPRLSNDGKWLAYVYHHEGEDGLALVDAAGKLWPVKLFSDSDFVMQPAWSADDSQIAFITWDHPQMPWDGTELRLAKLSYDGAGAPALAAVKTIAGDNGTAISQPEFSPDGRYLAYLSDAGGKDNPERFGQLWLYDLAADTHQQLTTAPAEHTAPAWVQGVRTFCWSPDSQALYYLRNTEGFNTLWRCDLATCQSEKVELPGDYTSLRQISIAPESGTLALLASSATIPERVITFQPKTQRALIRKRASAENIPTEQLAQPQAIQWQGHDGENVYGLYYPPTNLHFTGTGAPPLIIDVHGGPTSQRTARYEAGAQFFVTRGFAMLYVNYRGSTGYGRAYQDKLRGAWGIYDVQDCISGAQHLVEKGLADPHKLVIMGGSAGGYTVLQSLIDKPAFYRAAICLYGVSNQFTLVQDTHKFEERYSDSLLGTLPEAAELYRQRSPIFHADKIVDPIAVFQGADDPVVPKNQSDSIVASLRARGVPHEYHVYEGEGHGWRKPETIEAFYKSALAFLMQYVIYA